jgi:hypothetical protein
MAPLGAIAQIGRKSYDAMCYGVSRLCMGMGGGYGE